MFSYRFRRLLFATVLGFVVLPPCARADIVPTPFVVPNPVVTPLGGGLFEWTYDVSVDNTEAVIPGSLFTIYDFEGLAGTLPPPPDWLLTVLPVGITPPFQTPPDDPGIPNLTWTYTGTGVPILGPADLGLFSAISVLDTPKHGFFSGSGAVITDLTLVNGNTTHTLVPTATKCEQHENCPDSPEPASFGLLSVAWGLLFVRRKRK